VATAVFSESQEREKGFAALAEISILRQTFFGGEESPVDK
jgi:hypothetical protein